MIFFSDEIRRNPYPLYEQMRTQSPLVYVPPPFNGWLVFDYDGVKQVLSDHSTFSSQVPAPRNWFIFSDPPAHTKSRRLVAHGFTPRSIARLADYIRAISRELLDGLMSREVVDLAASYSVPLPMRVVSTMLGFPTCHWEQFKRWSDTVLKLSYARSGGIEAEQAQREFTQATAEMNDYLSEMIAQRKAAPADDLLTQLLQAEVDGEHLSQVQILGFFQLLLVAGQETTTNLINNAILCFIENPDQLERLRCMPHFLPAAIEEVLRYHSPLQWVMRTPRLDVTLHSQTIPAGQLVLPMIGSANRDARQFESADQFDISRNPNTHLAFGHGIHSCLGAALARMEAEIALSDLLSRFKSFELAGPWPPRKALHVHGPDTLPIWCTPVS